ncbi:MAG: hypothetical protein EB092_05550, partial [Chitinophagia bacterium]|nr:hypothetical protein [Chitinophagia bacterium]NDD16455.1 hypothetical protein [Chitinophagia bacterium]
MQNRYQRLIYLIKTFRKLALLSVLLFLENNTEAQNISEFQKNFQLNIRPTSSPIVLDGILDEAVWKTAEIAKDFTKKYPNNVGAPKQQTEVLTTYDDKNIYFAFKVYAKEEQIIKSLKRDVGYEGSDGIAIVLDPLGQKTNGFIFALTSKNVQSEDELTTNTEEKLSYSWDTKWNAATKMYAGYWIGEVAIPLKSLRYNDKQQFWGINFLRGDLQSNEYSCWTKVPPIFKSYDLGYTGVLNWPTAPPKSSTNKIILPYITGNSTTDDENGKTLQNSGNAGFDAKVTLNSSLNLDVTVNPDFSQVEVDQQVTNLTRFNIFLPEKRAFFLENGDLFSALGNYFISPFYSRTIGLDKQGNTIPILLGARISGNLNASTRIGMMNIQTGAKGNYSPENFSAFTIQKRFWQRSLLKTYFLNRENFISDVDLKKNPMDRYGRNAGMTLSLANNEGTKKAEISYHQSIKPTINNKDAFFEASVARTIKDWRFFGQMGNVGKNYYTDMGYVQRIDNYDALRDTTIRVGFKDAYANISKRLFIKNGKIGRIEFSLEEFVVFNADNSFSENENTFKINTEYRNSSGLKLTFTNSNLNLLYPTKPGDGLPLPSGTYQYNQFNLMYYSDMRKLFSWNSMLTLGQYYNGNITGVGAGIIWRNQPHLSFSLNAEVDKIQLPKIYGNNNLILIAPKMEYNFNTKLFWTTFVQFNTQTNNFNINSRLQFRYKPMSDFFLVYTDNYFTDPMLKNKNRA